MLYEKRIKIFISLSAVLLLACLVRLVQMQYFSEKDYLEKISELKKGINYQLKTVRGKIFDRKGRVLAVDEPQFQLHISYQLSSVMDRRVRDAKMLLASRKKDSKSALAETRKKIEQDTATLEGIIGWCSRFGIVPGTPAVRHPVDYGEREIVEGRIKKINDRIWNWRTFQAWRKNCSDTELYKKHKNNLLKVKSSDFIKDFEENVPYRENRLLKTGRIEIAEMYMTWPLVELAGDDETFAAQLEFSDVDGVLILPKVRRHYPYGSAGSQLIGWVGPPQESDVELFEDDKLSSYMVDEICGREDGVEYICETVLRGRRGELFYDIDRQLVSRTETQLGSDVKLTVDMELQQRIEKYIANPALNPNHYKAPTAAVVIDVTSGDILALVSLPTYDLNKVRKDYSVFAGDPNEPLRNRAINKQYPPGSVIKPMVLITALETGAITKDDVISCPAAPAGKHWPNCWIYNMYKVGHDGRWHNNARNAIRGSCNIYFSRLADRIKPSVLQKWLWNFGYGRRFVFSAPSVQHSQPNRRLREVQGQISGVFVRQAVSDFNDVPMLTKSERRLFGIGQGNLRVTPLQVANAMATIARGGIFKKPMLFIDDSNDKSDAPVNLNISQQTLELVRDGMKAVVSESGGTAYNQFADSGFEEQGVTVYGKTGSTEGSVNAWFAGFAEDDKGDGIAIVVLVEGGEHGSSDAGPLARDIIQFCIDAGYIGQSSPEVVLENSEQ